MDPGFIKINNQILGVNAQRSANNTENIKKASTHKKVLNFDLVEL